MFPYFFNIGEIVRKAKIRKLPIMIQVLYLSQNFFNVFFIFESPISELVFQQSPLYIQNESLSLGNEDPLIRDQ